MEEYKVIIIGAGISGMSCAIYLKRAGISTLLIENNAPGGQLNKINVIENYPGYEEVNGTDLAMKLYSQVMNSGVDYVSCEVEKVDYEKKKVITLENTYSYSYLVFATGRRERLLNLSHEEEFLGRGISLCATCDGALYRGRDVMVVGGGNSAVSEVLYLANICRRVYLVVRKSTLRAEAILKDRLLALDNVLLLKDSEIGKYLYDSEKIKGVLLVDGREILVDCIFLAIGSIPNSELFPGEKQDGYIKVLENGKSSIDSVYACGDVTFKRVYQLITASNDGVMVASDIIDKCLGVEF